MRKRIAASAFVIAVAAPFLGCDSRTSPTQPTAAAPPPTVVAVVTASYSGEFEVVRAKPGSDCVAQQFSRDAGRKATFMFQLLQGDPSRVGLIRFADYSECNLTAVSTSGELQLQVQPYCEWEIAGWYYDAACGKDAFGLMFDQIRLPNPDESGAIRGTGAIHLSRGSISSLPPVDLTVKFDLHAPNYD